MQLAKCPSSYQTVIPECVSSYRKQIVSFEGGKIQNWKASRDKNETRWLLAGSHYVAAVMA